jgi:hypothetical protein
VWLNEETEQMQAGIEESGTLVHDIFRGHVKEIRIHTWLLFACLLIAVGLEWDRCVAHAWPDGKYGECLHDFFDEENHEAVINLTNALGHEHPIQHHHREGTGTHRHRDHAHHHSKLPTLIESHWGCALVEYVFLLQLLAYGSLVLRLPFFRSSVPTGLIGWLMRYLVLSIVAQVFALMFLSWIWFHYPSVLSGFAALAQFGVFIMEIATGFDLFELRGKHHLLKIHRKQTHNEVMSRINNIIHDPSTPEDVREGAKKVWSNLQLAKSFVGRFFVNVGTAFCQARYRGKPKVE